MAEAIYFHASLYQFDQEARKAVIGRFNDTVNNAGVHVWYDENEETFVLKCPGTVGPDADETLANTVANYISEELRLGERNEREPHVTRYVESTFDDFLDTQEPTEVLEQIKTATSQDGDLLRQGLTPRKTPKSTVPTLHLIESQGAISLLKLYKLLELPDGMLQRVLTGKADQRTRRAVEKGLTCRAVTANLRFNGSSGYALPEFDIGQEALLLSMAPFHTIIGDAVAAPAKPEVRYWRFKEGHEVRTKQWLEGMGQTEQYDPNETPEMPKDAKKMLVADQNPALGRVRVPKGVSTMPSDSNSDSSDNEDAAKVSFSALLAPKKGNARLTDAAPGSSDESDTTGLGADSDFNSLLRPSGIENAQPSQTGRELVVASRPPSAPAVVVASDSTPAETSALMPRPSAGRSSQTSEVHGSTSEQASAVFASYGKEWAQVDTIGIAANAASQARWELEHGIDARKPTKGGIQLAGRSSQALTPVQTTGSASMSLSTGPELQRLQPLVPPRPGRATSALQATANVSDRSNAALPPEDEPWANNIVQNKVPTRRLVNDTVPVSRITAVQRPPGLGPSVHRPWEQSRIVARQRPQRLANLDTNKRDDKIIDDTVPEVQVQAVKRPPGLLPHGRSMQPTIAPQQHPDFLENSDEIVERLQPVAEEPTLKKYTMRQKAGKKGKSGTPSKAKAKVELPLPDPVPPPTHKKAEKLKAAFSAETLKAAFSMGKASGGPSNASRPAVSVQADPKDEKEATVPCSDESAQSELGRMLSTALDQDPGAYVEINFGLILIAHNDKELRKSAFSAKSFKVQAVTEEDFLPRVATSTRDAALLLHWPEAATELSTRSLYEFEVRDGSGNVRTISCASDAEPISSGIRTLAVAYMHFPHRVWDARYIILAPNVSDEPRSIADTLLFKSLITAGEAPSLYLKKPNSLAIEKLHAKREFTRIVEDGVRLVVSEVQDLVLRPLEGSAVDMHVVCLEREEMIREHRLWWEVKVTVDRDVEVPRLQAVVQELIREMDGMGYGNRGPWERREAEEMEQEVFVPYGRQNIGRW